MVYCGQQRKIRLHNQTASCYFNHINFVPRYARTQGGPQTLEFCLATCPMLKHGEPMLKNKGTLSATMPKLPPKAYILPNNEIPSKENFGFLAKTIHSPKCKTTLHPQKKQKLFTRHCKVTNFWVSGDKEIIKSNRLEMKHPSSWPSCGRGRMLGAYPNPFGVGAVPDWDIGSAKVSRSCWWWTPDNDGVGIDHSKKKNINGQPALIHVALESIPRPHWTDW